MPIRSSRALRCILEYMSILHFRPRMEQRFSNPNLLHISKWRPRAGGFRKEEAFNTVDQLGHKIFLEGTPFCWAVEFLRKSQTTGKTITHCLPIAWVKTDYHLKIPSNLLCCTSQMAVFEEDSATLANETQGTSHGGLPFGKHSEEQRNPLFAVLGNLSRLYRISPFVRLRGELRSWPIGEPRFRREDYLWASTRRSQIYARKWSWRAKITLFASANRHCAWHEKGVVI